MHYRSATTSEKQAIPIIVAFMLLKLLVHLPFNGRYGYHADELLYMAMADQPAWGYKEGPPLISFITWAVLQVSENSLWLLRLLPTLSGAALIGLTGWITVLLGGGPRAVLITCTAILMDPSFLATGYMMQPVIFDQLSWALSCLFLIRFIKSAEQSNLLYLGITAGLGMMNKFSIAVYLFSLLAAVMMQNRRALSWKDLLFVFLPALVIVFPHVLWQFHHGFPFVDQMGELEKYYWSKTDYPTLFKQLVLAHGMSSLVWITGLVCLLAGSARLRAYRSVGLSFILLQLVFLYLQAKTYYSFGAFPALYAAGAILISDQLEVWKKNFVKVAFFVTIIISGLMALPAVVPVLPLHHTVAWLDAMKRYTAITGPLQWDDGKVHRLPQYFAQMLGWEELAARTVGVLRSVPESERTRALILTDNYQQAGAIAFYAKKEVPGMASIRPSFFSQSSAQHSAAEYTIRVTSGRDQSSGVPAGLVSSHRVEYPNAEVNGSVIYLIRRPDVLAYRSL